MNIYDIAKEANVSIATVSRYLNGKPNISPKTRKKVQDALDKFQYTPSAIARGLVLDSMKQVGVLLHDIRNIYFANVAYTIEQELDRNGYHAIFYNTGDSNMEYYIRLLAQSRVDGLIIAGSVFMKSSVENALRQFHPGKPVIFINGADAHFRLDNACSILCADSDGIELAVRHLNERGHQRIAYVKEGDAVSERRKLEGYQSAMKRLNLPTHESWVVETACSLEGGISACRELLEQRRADITAIICGEDITAMGCLSYLSTHGIRVPEQIAVVGYNNSIYGKLYPPVLTSVDNKHSIMGTEAARALCDLLNGIDVPPKKVIFPDLFIGGTT